MIVLGKKQMLTVVKTVDFGVYLAEDMKAEADKRVLLPGNRFRKEQRKGINWKSLFIRILRTG